MLVMAISASGNAAELKPDTLAAWNDYLQGANQRLQESLQERNPFLLADKNSGVMERLRRGEVTVTPAVERNPQRVPSGLIHDWLVSAYIPNVRIESVLGVIRDYDDYKQFYKQTVIESRELGAAGGGEKFSMTLKNRSVMSNTAVEGDYQAIYTRLDEKRWYSTLSSSRIQEIENYRQTGERKLEEGEGTGYLWRMYTIARFEQRDGGVYVEIEAIGLSRDVPGSLRWMIDPMIRRISRNSLTAFMTSTRDAVNARSEITARNSKLPQTAGASTSSAFRER
jgi:hypothetical protein